MKIVLRKEALAFGLPFYFSGKPCPNGHVVERDTKSSGCRQCRKDKSARWRMVHPSRMAQHRDKWARENAVGMRASRKRWRLRNPGRINVLTAGRRARFLQRTPLWTDRDKLAKIYVLADFVTELTGVPHCVDHVIPLCGKKISGLHVVSNLQVLPRQENSGKSNRFQPYAEHYSPEFATALISC